MVKKIFSLSGLVYLLLYMFPFPFESYFYTVLEPLVFFISKTVFNIPDLAHVYEGSGDTTYDYVKVAALLIVSLIFGLVLLLTVKNPIKLGKIRNAILLYALYYVGLYMVIYGLSKLCAGQFPALSYGRLEQNYGDSSPMGLLWTFMGYSKPYTIFIGLAQITAGYTILFARTRTLGLLVAIGILVNIVFLNFCYDVPVKLFSVHLLLIAIVLAVPDFKIVYSFFILRIPAQLQPVQAPPQKYRIGRYILKGLIIAGITIHAISLYLNYAYTTGDYAEQNKIDGVYSVELFVSENDTLLSLATDSIRWKKIIISKGSSKVTTMRDSAERFTVKIDSIPNSINFISQKQPTQKYTLAYSEDKGKFVLTGLWKQKRLKAVFSKKNFNDYQLTKQEFHWINEKQNSR